MEIKENIKEFVFLLTLAHQVMLRIFYSIMSNAHLVLKLLLRFHIGSNNLAPTIQSPVFLKKSSCSLPLQVDGLDKSMIFH